MTSFLSRRLSALVLILSASLVFSTSSALGQAQANAADLVGSVLDPQKRGVAGAAITVRNVGTNLTREVIANDEGVFPDYQPAAGQL